MIGCARILFLTAALSILGGCAHPITISPDPARLGGNVAAEKIDGRLVYYFIEDIDKEVITPGGGGDKVKYKPYKDLDTSVYKILSDVFSSVAFAKSSGDALTAKPDYVAAVSISTNSSSPSVFTWIPTLFTIDLFFDFKDPASNRVVKVQTKGEGRAEFAEFKSNFNLSAQRASEDALNKLPQAIRSSGLAKIKLDAPNPNFPPAISKEGRLRQLKRLFDQGLIDSTIYNERQKAIISE